MPPLKNNQRLNQAIAQGKLQELRRILTGFSHKDLDRLNMLVQDPEAFANEISSLLPLSIKKMFERREISYKDLKPLIEDALKESVKENPHTLSDILFPIMMPAIRKAVAEDIKKMLDSINTTLEHSFSIKRIGWRFQSLFSGKSYAEIALSHAYIYHVQQVFLIHKTTGILLAQVSETESTKADMVSSMLAAIKDFVQDSFNTKDNNELQTMRIGNLTILIEQGPYAFIASVVEGNIPDEYKVLLKETIENTHIDFAYELEHFHGDTSIFSNNKYLLNQCLQKEVKTQKKKKPVFLIILFLIILAIFGYLLYGYINTRLHFNKLIQLTQTAKGYVITDRGKHLFGNYYLYCLKDPMATDIKTLINTSGLDSSKINVSLKPYFSADKLFILEKAKTILTPPKTISLKYNNGKLKIEGSATSEWLDFAKKQWQYIVGIHSVDFKVETTTTNKKKPIATIKKKKVKRNILAIEKHYFTFKYNVFELSAKQTEEFDKLINEVNNVLNFNFNQDSVPIIIVNSYTSYKGNVEANKIVAKHRAEQFINMMIDKGIPLESLVPKVKFIEDEDVNIPLRTVSFKVKYVKPGNL